jgi:endonuclease YncB( thermonuclease family)
MWILIFVACSAVETLPVEGVQPAIGPVEEPTDKASPPSTDHKSPARLVLDGNTIPVHWDDGDTFTSNPSTNGEGEEPVRARLSGYNTLESYGPVHRWGDWDHVALYRLAKEAGVRASSEVWNCVRLEGQGGYGRALVDCPELKLELLASGLAHLFLIDGEAEAKYLVAQQEAIANKAGMWAKGVPEGIITSLHSAHKRLDDHRTYDRIASPHSGAAEKYFHNETYSSCQEVCHHGSCMVYVPYAERYGDKRAECLALRRTQH